MFERSQSLLQYHNSIANLQDWTLESSRRRTRKTEGNRQLSELVMLVEKGANLIETLGTVEELSTSMSKKRKRGKRCATRDALDIDCSHLGARGRKIKAMMNLESVGTHVSWDFAGTLG